MAQLDIRLRGGDHFRDDLQGLVDRHFDEGRDEGLRELGEFWLRAARRYVPVESGELQSSLFIENHDGSVYLQSGLPYAAVIEFATAYGRNPRDRRAHRVVIRALGDPPRYAYRVLEDEAGEVDRRVLGGVIGAMKAQGWFEDG